MPHSLLSTHKTSILSKSWRYLFLAVPKIDINGSRFRPDLVNFINRRIMIFKNSSINAFRLNCGDLPEASDFHSWVTALLAFHNVQVLDITLRRRKCLLIEHFECKSLMVLKLHGSNIAIVIPESALYPNLKVLDLQYQKLRSQSNIFRFSDESYPLLEELRLKSVTFQKNEKSKPLLQISLPTLKKFVADSFDTELRQMDVDTPNLQHLVLEFDGGFNSAMEINICYMANLVYAYFDKLRPGQLFTKLFSKVNNVKELHLLERAAENLLDCDHLPQFPNLILLEIDKISEQSMWSVLQNSPNLETLHFNELNLYHNSQLQPKTVPLCFSKSLTEIGMKTDLNRIGEDGFETVRYMFENAKVLKRFVVYWRGIRNDSACKKLVDLFWLSPSFISDIEFERY